MHFHVKAAWLMRYAQMCGEFSKHQYSCNFLCSVLEGIDHDMALKVVLKKAILIDAPDNTIDYVELTGECTPRNIVKSLDTTEEDVMVVFPERTTDGITEYVRRNPVTGNIESGEGREDGAAERVGLRIVPDKCTKCSARPTCKIIHLEKRAFCRGS